MKQGQSDATKHKNRGFASAFAINLTICRKGKSEWHRTRPYFHFDLNAGSGWNHEVNQPRGVMGSPLAFLAAAESANKPEFVAHFVEQDDARGKALAKRPKILGDRRCFVHIGDNADFVPAIPAIVRRNGEKTEYARGSILIDPNGPTGAPWDEVAAVSMICPRLDLFINWSGTAMKRLPDGHEKRLEVDDLPTLFHKEAWLVRIPHGPWQWSLLLGRNYRTGDHKAAGFMHWDSAEGAAYIEKLKLTGRERKGD